MEGGNIMRKFNVTGTCVPDLHYMVDITAKLEAIKKMIDDREYFTINRGRQYGKTTTLLALEHFLRDEYIVISLSFEGLGEKPFSSEERFCREFLKLIKEALELSGYSDEEQSKWEEEAVDDFTSLSRHIRKVCKASTMGYVLMIDEVDKSSNNVIFLNFLSKLRAKYLARASGKDFTFHSVILAGVYDVKNIKLRLIQEGLLVPASGETTFNNSPWNIATDFEVDMSFSAFEIASMLSEYEVDKKTGMGIEAVAKEIHVYTSGYPVLVSRICQIVDQKLGDWTPDGVRRAVKFILEENSPLFDSLIKNLAGNIQLSEMTYDILMRGARWSFTIGNPTIGLGFRYGYFYRLDGRVKISNKIFELFMTDYFISQDQLARLKATVPQYIESDIIEDGKFDMQVCLEKFAKYYQQYYSKKDVEFLEREARYLVLFFLNPLLNGRGFAHIESAFTDDRRMDVVVNYLNQQFILELKIWHGEKRQQDGLDQLLGYMEKMGLNEGYMLTFDFRQQKEEKQEWIQVERKNIFRMQV